MKFDGKVIILLFLILVAIAVVVVKSPSYNEGYRSDEHPMLEQIRANFTLMNPAYKDVPLRVGKSSYTEDKKVIYLCLNHPKTKEVYNLNVMMHVALHELAHYISKTYGHNDEFRKNFKMLLDQATRMGLHDPTEIIPPDYCGIKTLNK